MTDCGFDINYIAIQGDAWAVPAAAAVFFAVLACVVPHKDGMPLVNLKKWTPCLRQPRIKLHGESQHDPDAFSMSASDTGSESAGESWELFDGSLARDQQALTTPAIEVVVQAQDPGRCSSCQAAVEVGDWLAVWKPPGKEEGFLFHVACCAEFACDHSFAMDLMAALVDFEWRAPAAVAALVRKAIDDMDRWLDKHHHPSDGEDSQKTLPWVANATSPSAADSADEDGKGKGED